MRKIQQILMSVALVLSGSAAMASTEIKEGAMTGFYALSQVARAETSSVAAFSDKQLDGVIGGFGSFGGFLKSSSINDGGELKAQVRYSTKHYQDAATRSYVRFDPCWIDDCGRPPIIVVVPIPRPDPCISCPPFPFFASQRDLNVSSLGGRVNR